METLDILDFFAIIFGFLCNILDFSNTVAWVTRPERPKGVKDVVKQLRRLLHSAFVVLYLCKDKNGMLFGFPCLPVCMYERMCNLSFAFIHFHSTASYTSATPRATPGERGRRTLHQYLPHF